MDEGPSPDWLVFVSPGVGGLQCRWIPGPWSQGRVIQEQSRTDLEKVRADMGKHSLGARATASRTKDALPGQPVSSCSRTAVTSPETRPTLFISAC